MPSFTSELIVDDPVSEIEIGQDDVVAYAALSSENRAAFDRALAGGGETNYRHHRWRGQAVAYEGEYYPTSTWGGENAWRLYTIIAGWLVVGVGAAGLGGRRAIEWWQQSRESTPK
jgi:hypothetical protein